MGLVFNYELNDILIIRVDNKIAGAEKETFLDTGNAFGGSYD